jgi:hypothetical protein
MVRRGTREQVLDVLKLESIKEYHTPRQNTLNRLKGKKAAGFNSAADNHGAPLLRISACHMLIIIHQGSRHDAGLRAQQVGNQSG